MTIEEQSRQRLAGRLTYAYWVLLAAALLCLAAASCTPTNPTNIDDHRVTVIIGGPGASPSPAASAGPAGPVAAVSVNAYGGQECPEGTPPATGQREVRAGCTQAVTCNPLDAHGAVIYDTGVAGAAPDFFNSRSDTSGVAVVGQTGNPYNLRLTGVGSGSVFLQCIVRGIPSALVEFKVAR